MRIAGGVIRTDSHLSGWSTPVKRQARFRSWLSVLLFFLLTSVLTLLGNAFGLRLVFLALLDVAQGGKNQGCRRVGGSARAASHSERTRRNRADYADLLCPGPTAR